MNRPKRAAVYARVSTARDQNPEMQTHALRQLAQQRGWNIVAEYVDVGVSGTKDRRPELDKLMKHVQRGGVDVVVCWRFDRFARSVRHLVLALDDFKSRGVDFVSMEDGIDTSTPAGRFTFHVIGAVAELEAELIRERTRCGIAAARRRGARIGRPHVKAEADDVSKLKASGMSVRAITRELGIGVATVHRLLRGGVPKGSPDGARKPLESKRRREAIRVFRNRSISEHLPDAHPPSATAHPCPAGSGPGHGDTGGWASDGVCSATEQLHDSGAEEVQVVQSPQLEGFFQGGETVCLLEVDFALRDRD